MGRSISNGSAAHDVTTYNGERAPKHRPSTAKQGFGYRALLQEPHQNLYAVHLDYLHELFHNLNTYLSVLVCRILY